MILIEIVRDNFSVSFAVCTQIDSVYEQLA